MEELLQKHRTERKDLQNKITSKKKNASKKTRKGVNDECDNLERELKERQQAEIDALEGAGLETGVSALNLHETTPDDVRDDEVDAGNHPTGDQQKQVRFDSSAKSEPNPEEGTLEAGSRSKKPNRQKARLARRAAEQEALVEAAAEEAASLPDLREQEMSAMKKHKERLGLQETFIRPDGHCLYSACAHSIPKDKGSAPASSSYQLVRSATADFISEHPDDFSVFLEEPLDSYVKKIKNTAEWGGQLELQAIARAYNVTINVLQADGRVEKIESGSESSNVPDVWLAYYKHSFGLGEHYNALARATGS